MGKKRKGFLRFYSFSAQEQEQEGKDDEEEEEEVEEPEGSLLGIFLPYRKRTSKTTSCIYKKRELTEEKDKDEL